MANIREIKAHFTSDKKYFENAIGMQFYYTQATGPYEYLLGALAGCYVSTLSSFPRTSNWKELSIDIQGIKRETVPTTLETTTISLTVKGAEDKEEFRNLAEKACKACSIYQTLEKVSKMELFINYED